MKYLSDYTQEAQSKILKKYNAFFAFSQEQFNKAKKEGLKYIARGAGLYHEAGKSKEFDKDWANVIAEGIKQDLKENGKEKIINRELENYECYYTGDVTEAVYYVSDYGITEQEVIEVYRKNKDNYDLF